MKLVWFHLKYITFLILVLISLYCNSLSFLTQIHIVSFVMASCLKYFNKTFFFLGFQTWWTISYEYVSKRPIHKLQLAWRVGSANKRKCIGVRCRYLPNFIKKGRMFIQILDRNFFKVLNGICSEKYFYSTYIWKRFISNY